MRRYSLARAITGLVLLLMLLTLFWAGLRTSGPQSQIAVLPGGSTLELYHATWGTNHHRILGSAWERLGLRVPQAVRRPLKWRAAAVEDAGPTRTPALLLWFRESSNTIEQSRLTLTMVGDSGEELELNPTYHNWLGSTGASKSQTFWVALDVFPWRSSRLKLLVYRGTLGSPSAPERLATFTIPNPRAGRHPHWHPEPLPATHTNGTLEVTLAAWQPATDPGFLSRQSSPHSKSWHETKLRIQEHGEQAKHWFLAQAVWSDALGNRAANARRWSGMTAGDDRIEIGMPPQLSTNESALKLQLGFARDAGGSFAPDELWQIRGVRIPGTNELIEPLLTTNVQGLQVTLDCLSGPRTKDGPILRRSGRKVVLRFNGPADSVQVRLLGVTDDRGRPVPLGDGWGQSDSDFEFGVKDWPTDAATVDLSVAVQRVRWVEFMVPPYSQP